MRIVRSRLSRFVASGLAVAVVVGGGINQQASAVRSSGERAVFVPITPCRLFDTRPGTDTVGSRTSPLGPGETYAVETRGPQGNCNLPADAVGISMNVAIIGGTAASFLTVFPSDVALPLAANLNWVADQPPTPNKVDVDLAADGRVSFYNFAGSVHIAADVVGYYADHDHDDRYYPKSETYAKTETYSKAEADAALAGKAAKPTGNGSVIVGAPAFTPDTSGISYSVSFQGGALTAPGGCFRAPVALPQGATLVSALAHVNDMNAGTDTVLLLFRDPVGSVGGTAIASADAVGVAGQATIIDNTITAGTAVVNNSAFSYFVALCPSANLTFFDIVVNFTYP